MLIVVGGHSRNVGKTSVVAGLIAALPEMHWTAVKITQYGHGVCSVNGKACHCAVDEHRWAITEERDRSGKSDSSRYLVAGATRSLWVRTKQGRLEEVMPSLQQKLSAAENVIMESNSVLKFVQPELYLPVLDPATADFKASSREYLNRASAVILHEDSKHGGKVKSLWDGISLSEVEGRPVFRIAPPQYVSSELVHFVRQTIDASSGQRSSV
jgi:hypothetical protein